MRIRQTKDEELIRRLHKKCFPGDEFYEHKNNVYWVAMSDDEPAGFAIATPNTFNEVFLSRAGVLTKFQGQILQRKLIIRRIQWAKRNGYNAIVTYASTNNGPSIKNLLNCGLEIYEPGTYWAGKDVVYFGLDL